MLLKDATEVVDSLAPSSGFYSRLFLVPKPTGEFRPVIDLSTLNTHIRCDTFKMETPATIQEALQKDEWTITVDIKDAYFHIPVHPAFRKFLRFTVGGVIYQCRALPFGLSVAPRIITMVRILGSRRWSSTMNLLSGPSGGSFRTSGLETTVL